MINDPQKEVTKKRSQLVVELQAGRVIFQPQYSSLQGCNRVHTEYLVDKLAYLCSIVDKIRPKGDANDNFR
jgi:hypothetical protein